MDISIQLSNRISIANSAKEYDAREWKPQMPFSLHVQISNLHEGMDKCVKER